jgi:hypothetical protein
MHLAVFLAFLVVLTSCENNHPTFAANADPGQRANDDVQQDEKRFQTAYALIQDGKFGAALRALRQNIAETPDAGNIDYAYGWATVCAAHLGDAELTLAYYETMRTRFFGWRRLGAKGAQRNWDNNLNMARQAVAASGLPEKERERILARMTELDRLGRDSAIKELKVLIRRAQEGDQVAIGQLRSQSQIEFLVDLIVDKELKLAN